MYELEEKLARTESIIWMVYVVLAEIMVRFGPCILLITLNLLMIRDFHISLNRRISLINSIKEMRSSIPRKRKITVSSYIQTNENHDKIYDGTLSNNVPIRGMTSISVSKKQSSTPLVINVSICTEI